MGARIVVYDVPGTPAPPRAAFTMRPFEAGGKDHCHMKRIWRSHRAVATLLGAGVLFQAGGCSADTQAFIVETILPILLQVVLSTLTGGVAVV